MKHLLRKYEAAAKLNPYGLSDIIFTIKPAKPILLGVAEYNCEAI